MAGQQWVITVDQAHLNRLDDVVEGLQSAGLRVDRVLHSLGQVSGRTESAEDAESSPQQRLAAVTGVESAVASQKVRISPPDAEIQ